jgi:hypothetical protein
MQWEQSGKDRNRRINKSFAFATNTINDGIELEQINKMEALHV